MEDRFKFRIYCKSENKMMIFNNPTLIDGDILQGGLLFKNYDHKIKNVHEVKPEDLILMQCTGLKDKNGKLIFEGDILKTKAGLAKVVYFHAEFILDSIQNIDFSFIDWDTTEQAVIGNIYENTELLEVNNANIQS